MLETREWLDSLDYVLAEGGPERAGRLLQQLSLHAKRAAGVNLPFTATTPYQNTIPSVQSPRFLAARRWSAASRAWCAGTRLPWWSAPTSCRKALAGIFRPLPRPQLCMKWRSIIFCAPRRKLAIATWFIFRGTQRPACMLGRILKAEFPGRKLENFRRELKSGGGLSSYPHPWLMPDFWEFPTVSMGLGPIQAIYQARFIRYLENRGLKDIH